jgi:hypothetical protein
VRVLREVVAIDERKAVDVGCEVAVAAPEPAPDRTAHDRVEPRHAGQFGAPAVVVEQGRDSRLAFPDH